MGLDSIRKSKRTINLASWVKQNAHPVRETALIFFALALFMGVIWVSGKDVEPVVYILGSISTLLFAGPALARYVKPDTKPVRHMNYDEILDFIKQTNAKTDWHWIKTSWAEEAFLKEDPRLRIRVRWDDTGIHDKDFNEPWLITQPNQIATSYWYDLSYDGGLIDRFILVSVNGGEAKLPLPESTTLDVDPLSYKVAQVFDKNNTLDDYLTKVDLSLKKTE